MLNVCETFVSIQGESTHAGKICAFIRLSGCNLSCSYCDTQYAMNNGTHMSIDDLLSWVALQDCHLVEITGGEPLLQNETPDLVKQLLKAKHTVLIETNGSLDISTLPAGSIRIVDVKCPASNMGNSFYLPNVKALTHYDECKFVISDDNDFTWACSFVTTHNLADICTVIFSPNQDKVLPHNLAAWMIEKRVHARLGLQLHKCIWGSNTKGK